MHVLHRAPTTTPLQYPEKERVDAPWRLDNYSSILYFCRLALYIARSTGPNECWNIAHLTKFSLLTEHGAALDDLTHRIKFIKRSIYGPTNRADRACGHSMTTSPTVDHIVVDQSIHTTFSSPRFSAGRTHIYVTFTALHLQSSAFHR